MKGIKVCRYINLSLPVTAVNLPRHFSYDLFEKRFGKLSFVYFWSTYSSNTEVFWCLEVYQNVYGIQNIDKSKMNT